MRWSGWFGLFSIVVGGAVVACAAEDGSRLLTCEDDGANCVASNGRENKKPTTTSGTGTDIGMPDQALEQDQAEPPPGFEQPTTPLPTADGGAPPPPVTGDAGPPPPVLDHRTNACFSKSLQRLMPLGACVQAPPPENPNTLVWFQCWPEAQKANVPAWFRGGANDGVTGRWAACDPSVPFQR